MEGQRKAAKPAVLLRLPTWSLVLNSSHQPLEDFVHKIPVFKEEIQEEVEGEKDDDQDDPEDDDDDDEGSWFIPGEDLDED